jgi:hypothetical protein
MIVKHDFSNLVMTPKRENFFDFFLQAYDAINKLQSTIDVIDDYHSGELDELDELDELENQNLDSVEAIVLFSRGGFSTKPAMYICARNVVVHINDYNTFLSEHVDYGMTLEDSEQDLLSAKCKKIISELLYLLWYEFDVEEQLNRIKAGEDFIDEIVKMYCDSFCIEQKVILENIETLRDKFPFHLSIFEDYPEYESQFEALMGPLLGAVDEAKISIELVKKVIDGRLTPDELLEELNGLDADFDGMNCFN